MHPLVMLAYIAIEQFLQNPDSDFVFPDDIPDELYAIEAGAFVTLLKGDDIRGCIGTIGPSQESVPYEIIANAIAAATKDARYAPVTLVELPDLGIIVDIMDGEPEKIDSIAELNPLTYGVIVEKGQKIGLMLPDQLGVTTIEKQLDGAMKKAGILDGLYGCDLYRFAVERFTS